MDSRETHARPGAPGRAGGWARRAVVGAVCTAAAATTVVTSAPSAGAIVPGPNGRIAFESSRTGNPDIFTMNPDGSTQLNVTNNPAVDVFPAWSPDGTRITFSSDRADPGNLDVYVMNADGSNVKRLTHAKGEDRGTSWTSDGQKIVFHSSRNADSSHSFDIFTMNPDGSDQTRIFKNGSAAYVCGNSTNGRIVFNSSGDPLGTNPEGDFEIFTMNMTGGDVFQVTHNAVIDSGPKWSPDCTRISYNSLDTTSLDIHRINADGTHDVNLTNTPGVFDAFSAWSPNGNRIVFSSNRDVNFEIYTMNSSNGGNVKRLTFTGLGQADLRPDWGTNTTTPPDTALVCRPSTSGGGNAIEVCTVSDTDGIRFVQVGNAATNQQETALTFDCSNAPRSAEFRVPANTKYNVTVADCANPRNTTSFVLTEDGRVR
jgi:Tol biopolymer transport system component